MGTDEELSIMNEETINEDFKGIDLSGIRPLSKSRKNVVLSLELSRLRKKGVITLETFMKTLKEWGNISFSLIG